MKIVAKRKLKLLVSFSKKNKIYMTISEGDWVRYCDYYNINDAQGALECYNPRIDGPKLYDYLHNN